MGLVELYNGWIWFALIAFGILTGLISFVYMLGSILLNDRMKTWAKMELSELFYSAIIVAIAIPGLTLIDGVVQGSLGVTNTGVPVAQGATSMTTTWLSVSQPTAIGTQTKVWRQLDICAESTETVVPEFRGIPSCHMKLSIWYMQEMFGEAKNFAYDIYLSYIWTSMAAEFTINKEYIFEKAGFFTFTPWKGFFTTTNTIKSLLFDWSLKLMMLQKFQEVLLRFIGVAIFPTFFVMGVVLRSFAFTRKLGGLLLAIAIALYFIFPAFYAFGALVVIELKNKASTAWLTDTDANPYGLANPDPPIANLVYTKGDFPMLGGMTGMFSTKEAHEMLSKTEGMDPNSFLDYMERGAMPDQGGNPGTSNVLMPSFDLNSKSINSETAFNSGVKAYSTWFNNALKKGKSDNFINLAFSDNGYIDSLSRITFFSVFFSFLSIIGTIAAVRSLSITFGGDIEIAGLTRLI